VGGEHCREDDRVLRHASHGSNRKQQERGRGKQQRPLQSAPFRDDHDEEQCGGGSEDLQEKRPPIGRMEDRSELRNRIADLSPGEKAQGIQECLHVVGIEERGQDDDKKGEGQLTQTALADNAGLGERPPREPLAQPVEENEPQPERETGMEVGPQCEERHERPTEPGPPRGRMQAQKQQGGAQEKGRQHMWPDERPRRKQRRRQ